MTIAQPSALRVAQTTGGTLASGGSFNFGGFGPSTGGAGTGGARVGTGGQSSAGGKLASTGGASNQTGGLSAATSGALLTGGQTFQTGGRVGTTGGASDMLGATAPSSEVIHATGGASSASVEPATGGQPNASNTSGTATVTTIARDTTQVDSASCSCRVAGVSTKSARLIQCALMALLPMLIRRRRRKVSRG